VGVRLLFVAAAAGLLLGLGVASGSHAAGRAGSLVGDVGAGDSFTISLKDTSGAAVTHLDPGTYTLLVHDHSAIHNFDLSGPGVSVATDIGAVGDQSFAITVTDGVYTFVCDAHPSQMKGSFAVGTATLPTKTTTTTTPPPPTPATKLSAGIGPGTKLSLRPTSGLSAGKFKVTVSDRTATDGFRLSGPGLSRATGVKFKGTTTWTVALNAGTYAFSSVRHPKVRHTFRISG
jgi:plastocyanin